MDGFKDGFKTVNVYIELSYAWILGYCRGLIFNVPLNRNSSALNRSAMGAAKSNVPPSSEGRPCAFKGKHVNNASLRTPLKE